MSMTLCYHCMKEKPSGADICPHCGRRNLQVSTLQRPYALPCGTLLHKKYVIGRVLGEGGFGITYIGYDLTLQIRVCIKEYFQAGMAQRTSGVSQVIRWRSEAGYAKQASFLEEARNAAKLHGLEAVVQVWDVFEENNTSYIVMSYIEGTTIKESLVTSGKPLAYRQCVELFDPVLEALSEIHKLHIIHRDISPDNLMLRPDGKLMLLDLGAAKNLNSREREESTRVAKKGFSPPEQYLEDGNIGPWTDVYSLTATLYYCVTGKVPPNVVERKEGQQLELDAFSAKAARVITKGLAVHIEERYQSVAELRAALWDSLRGRIWVERLLRYKASLIAAALAVACLCGFGAVALSIQSDWEARTVVELGTSNSSMANDGNFCIFNDVEYFIGQENTLLRVEATGGVFYLDQAVKVLDEVFDLVTDGEQLFFIHRESGGDTICRMNIDGSGFERLYREKNTYLLLRLQYARLLSGEEYLYAHTRDEIIQENDKIVRYDLHSGAAEEIVSGKSVYWYSVYENYIYYTTVDYDLDKQKILIDLIRCDLDGNRAKLLNDTDQYYGGIVDDGYLILETRDNMLVVCDLEGNKLSTFFNNPDSPESAVPGGQDYNIHIDLSQGYFYINGWLYYSGSEDNSLHRLKVENPENRELVLEGHTAKSLYVTDTFCYFLEMQDTDYEIRKRCQIAILNLFTNSLYTVGEEYIGWDGLSTLPVGDIRYKLNEDGSGVIVTGVNRSWIAFMLPPSIDGLPVVAIGEYAFEGSELMMIGLPSTVTQIGEQAFYQCSQLSFVGLSEGLRTIGFGAFGECSSLEHIALPESLEQLESLAIAVSGLKEIHIPANVKEIGGGSFTTYCGYGFETISVSPDNSRFLEQDGVLFERIGDGYALLCYPSGRTESSYRIPDSVTEIRDYAFGYADNLTEVIIPDSVKQIRSNAFYGADLTEITVSSECIVADDLGTEITVRRR